MERLEGKTREKDQKEREKREKGREKPSAEHNQPTIRGRRVEAESVRWRLVPSRRKGEDGQSSLEGLTAERITSAWELPC